MATSARRCSRPCAACPGSRTPGDERSHREVLASRHPQHQERVHPPLMDRSNFDLARAVSAATISPKSTVACCRRACATTDFVSAYSFLLRASASGAGRGVRRCRSRRGFRRDGRCRWCSDRGALGLGRRGPGSCSTDTAIIEWRPILVSMPSRQCAGRETPRLGEWTAPGKERATESPRRD